MNKRMRYMFLSFLLLMVLPFVPNSYCESIGIPPGIYEYVYEYNTADFKENHYIKISKENGKPVGYYYGTSDDFDDAREGYLPWYFSQKMLNLRINGNNISFEIQPQQFFTKAVTPIKTEVDNSIWNIRIRDIQKRYYQGEYKGNRLIIQSDGIDKRIFNKIK